MNKVLAYLRYRLADIGVTLQPVWRARAKNHDVRMFFVNGAGVGGVGRVLVADYGEDGYELYLPSRGRTIDEDVEIIAGRGEFTKAPA